MGPLGAETVTNICFAKVICHFYQIVYEHTQVHSTRGRAAISWSIVYSVLLNMLLS